MDQMQKSVQKQVIIRMFQPDMNRLKATAKQLSATPGIKLGLYGQSGEVLVVVTAQAIAAAAATELTERAAAHFEQAMGDCVYARGKESLAHTVAAEMIEDESTVTAADAETGNLLEAEFNTTNRGEKVFDFGQASFRNARMADKIADTALMDDESADDPLQQAADRSYAAAKCTRAEFGTSITGTKGGKAVFAAVTYGNLVYIRAIRPAPDAGKTAALTLLDMIRRLILEMPVPYARVFKAGREVEWDQPMEVKGKKGGKKKNMLLPVITLILLAVALGVACWYIYNTFFIKNEGNVPAANDTSISASQPLEQTPESLPAQSGDTTQTPPSAEGQGNTTGGVVHPFN